MHHTGLNDAAVRESNLKNGVAVNSWKKSVKRNDPLL